MNNEVEDFGSFIKGIRKSKGLTLAELSEESGVSQPFLSQIENNKRKPSSEILNKLAKPLGISPLTLMYKAEYADKDEVESLQRAEKILKEIDTYKDDDYYFDSSKNMKIKSKEFSNITMRMNLYYNAAVKWSEDALLNEVEQVIIREHFSELLLGYKKIIESYLDAKLRWGNYRENFIDIHKDSMNNAEIKELFFKQELERQIDDAKSKLNNFPFWLTMQPDFLEATSLKNRIQNEQENQK